jgi:hypothetical protein
MTSFRSLKLKSEQMVTLVPGHDQCQATDKITVEGCKIVYMYREEPKSKTDSGWRFFPCNYLSELSWSEDGILMKSK